MQPSFCFLFTDNTAQRATKRNVQERAVCLKHQDSEYWHYTDKTTEFAQTRRERERQREILHVCSSIFILLSCWKCLQVLFYAENYLSCQCKVHKSLCLSFRHNWNELWIPGFSLIKCQLSKNIDSNPFGTPDLQLKLVCDLSDDHYCRICSLEYKSWSPRPPSQYYRPYLLWSNLPM